MLWLSQEIMHHVSPLENTGRNVLLEPKGFVAVMTPLSKPVRNGPLNWKEWVHDTSFNLCDDLYVYLFSRARLKQRKADEINPKGQAEGSFAQFQVPVKSCVILELEARNVEHCEKQAEAAELYFSISATLCIQCRFTQL